MRSTSLRSYQADAVDRCLSLLPEPTCLVAPTGAGKCLGPNVGVLLYDGRVRKASEITVGDELMGPDSLPRRVVSVCSGIGEMYEVRPVKGEVWTCNDVHVLTLVHTETGATVDVPLNEWLGWSKYRKHCHKLFKPTCGVNFAPPNALSVDPYFIGIWIGDGAKNLSGVTVHKPDDEIMAACGKTADLWGLQMKVLD